MSELVSLKITVDQDVNYLLFGDQICRNLEQLDAFCTSRALNLLNKGASFRYYWIDDDDDEIRITTDEDYRSFLQAMGKGKARLYVAVVKSTTTSGAAASDQEVNATTAAGPKEPKESLMNLPTHQHVVCDVCDEIIVGHRYKCLTCHDYDICMSCEAKLRHKDHLMVRIPKPEMVRSSQSMVSRMFEKMRTYAVRITATSENETVKPEPADDVVPGNNERIDSRRAHARAYHRKFREENAAFMKAFCNAKKQNTIDVPGAGVDERCAEEPKEKPTRRSLVERTKLARDLMMWLDYSKTGAATPLETTSSDAVTTSSTAPTVDHVALAKAAAVAAATSAARAADALQTALTFTSSATAPKGSDTAATDRPSFEACQQEVYKTFVEQLRQREEQLEKQQQQTKTVQPRQPPINELAIFAPFTKLTWPTNEQLLSASVQVSKLLDPLGLNFELRRKDSSGAYIDSPASPSAGSAAKVAADTVHPSSSAQLATSAVSVADDQMKQDEAAETKPKIVQTHQATSATAGETEQKETVPEAEQLLKIPLLESDAVCPKPATEESKHQEPADEDDEDDTANTSSSASLLTDDDQDLIEVPDDVAKACSPAPTMAMTSSSPSADKTWTLVDIPPEQDDEADVKVVPLNAIAKLIGRDTPILQPEMVTSQPQLKDKKKSKTGEVKLKDSKKAAKPPKTASSELDYENLGKMLAKHVVKEEGKQQQKEKTILPASSTSSGPSSSSSSTRESPSAASPAPGGKPNKSSSRKPSSSGSSSTPSSQPKEFTIYSHQPNVNHAIHTMMTMGFSNQNGWLTQLLESLNGDIPKALDLLLQHRH